MIHTPTAHEIPPEVRARGLAACIRHLRDVHGLTLDQVKVELHINAHAAWYAWKQAPESVLPVGRPPKAPMCVHCGKDYRR